VRQHISGVVDKVTYCIVENLTDFPAMKEFLKIDQDLTNDKKVEHFLGHSLSCTLRRQWKTTHDIRWLL